MIKLPIERGLNDLKHPRLDGIFFRGESETSYGDEILILMGGFARVATEEKILLAIAKNMKKPTYIFNWQGMGESGGYFSDTTVDKLFIDLKRVVGYFMSKGFFKFHLIGHSLGACVVAKALDNPFINTVKQILISPVLNQDVLLRYWFAKENGYAFNFESWEDYHHECFKFRVNRRASRPQSFSYWQYEDQFQQYCNKARVVKGMLMNSYYWEIEGCNNYFDFLPCNMMTYKVYSDNILHIHGDNDSSIPLESVEFEFNNSNIFEGADHYLTGYEEEVANVVSEFIG